MAKKEIKPKVILEREYIVPLRKGWLKVPRYKRANKAVKTLKEFIVRHMKIYDRDLRKVKIDELVNNEIRFRGMYKPLAKIKVKAKKYDDGIVRIELINLPVHVKFARLREEKKLTELEKKTKVEVKKEEKAEEIKPKPEEEEKAEEAKEKKEAAKEESLAKSKQQAKEIKHISKDKKVQIHRKALSR
jgi:large subunit ribosomal protein L31e